VLHFARSPGRGLLGRHVEAPKIAVWQRHWEKPMSNVTLPGTLRATAVLRDGHLVTVAIDALLALHGAFKRWHGRRRTLRALAKLDEHQLRDIGLTRGDTTPSRQADETCHRALAALDDNELVHLSDLGRRTRRDAMHGRGDNTDHI
jgi:uncharacterized protein YjiS (DUF1127 family)